MESYNVVVKDVGTEKSDNVEYDVATSGPLTEDHDVEEQPDASQQEISEDNTEETTDQPTQNKGPSVRVQKNHPRSSSLEILNKESPLEGPMMS